MLFKFFLLPLSIFCLLTSCSKNAGDEQSGFEEDPVSTRIIGSVPEVSGIAASSDPGASWLIEDSGNPPELIMLSASREIIKRINVGGAQNRDWEDIVSVFHPDRARREIYIGDIGNNNADPVDAVIYHFDEPVSPAYNIATVQAIHFSYEDGPRDAEALLVDQATRDIFIITKRETLSRVYKISYPYQLQNVAKRVGELAFTGAVSATAAPGDQEVLVKTYQSLYHYRRKAGQSLGDLLTGPSSPAPYIQELQGEAVSFAADNSGYYTISEAPLGGNQSVSFYRRR